MAEVSSPNQMPHRKVRLGSSSAFALSAQVLNLATAFLASILIARSLGPTGKGMLSVLQQVPAILAIVLNMGINTANTYFVGKGRHGVGEVLGNSFLVAAVVGGIGLPIALLFTIGPASVVSNVPLLAGIIASIFLPVTLAYQFVYGINVGLGEMKALSRTQMVGSVISIGTVLIAFSMGKLTVAIAILASVLNTGIALILNTARVRKYAARVRVSLPHLKESARYSAKAYFVSLAGYLNYRSDVIVVGYLAGAAVVGIYSTAVSFAELMWYAPNALASALLSKSMQAEQSDADMLALRSSRVTALLMLLISLAAAFLIRPVIYLAFGAKFLPAVTPFLLLLPGVWMIGIARVLSSNLAAKGFLFPWLAAGTAASNILLNLILVPHFGANGAAISSTISYGGSSAITMYIFTRETGASPRHWLIVTKKDLVAIGASAKSYVAALRAKRAK